MSLECIDSNITNPWSNLSSGKGICESNNILVSTKYLLYLFLSI